MARDPILAIEFFTSGFYTYRSQLFAPFKGIGINVVTFRDPVIDGANFELTDKLQWTRRPGFSIFCPTPLADSEVVNQFYSSRLLNGTVVPFADTNRRLLTFSSSALTPIIVKTTTQQGYISTVGNVTYFSDGAATDLQKWDGRITSSWGLAAPTVVPTVSGTGFWQPDTSFPLGTAILDPNGNIERVTAILAPNGAITSPQNATTKALGGSLSLTWGLDSVNGGYFVTEGWQHIQQTQNFSLSSGTIANTFTANVTVGNVVIVEIGATSTNFTPSITSVTDNLGNTYTLQASGNEVFHGGGGNNYLQSAWLYTAPITTGGACTVTVVSNNAQLGVIVHEVQGISATASATATRGGFNGSSMATPISFSGTQFVMSSVCMESAIPNPTTPTGYTPGGSLIFTQLYDAYAGATTSSTPTWLLFGSPPGSYVAFAIAAAFPITSLSTGYTPYLFLYNFNPNVPAGATIVGVVLNLPKVNFGGGTVQDQSVKMVIGGSVTGSDQAAAGNWNNSGFTVSLYGAPNSTWGTSVTAAQINAGGSGGFGFVVSADITATGSGSIIPEVGFTPPNAPTMTVYYKQSSGTGGPGISGANEPIWSTTVNGTVNDGGIAWTNYGPIQTWFPATGFTTPVVTLDPNGNLELSTYVQDPTPQWLIGNTYSIGNVVYFGGAYWISLINSNTGIVPSSGYVTSVVSGSTTTTTPAWALTTTPLVTGLIAPVWNLANGGNTTDGSFTWTNIGQGTGLALMGYAYVYAYRTIYGHLTTSSPFSQNTGAILGPVQGSISSFAITSDVVTFSGANNFVPGNVFEVTSLQVGTYLNEQSFTVLTSVPSETFPLTSVSITSNVVTITAVNNLTSGQSVTFTGVGTATFLNGVTLTVLSSGLSSSQFEANFTHANYGPTGDTGNVEVLGSWTAAFTHANVSTTLDSGLAIPLIATISGFGTASPLCNATASISSVSVTASIVTVLAPNYFQPGLWVTLSGITNASFLEGQQVQVTAVDQPVGTQNTQFQFYFNTPNYAATAETGTATFNAVEIYRTSDGGGTYLFTGAVTNPGANIFWEFDDFTVDADLDELLIAPLSHLNDPPPGAPGSTITTAVGTLMTYWNGRLWMAVGNYVYFDAGPDCTNGVPEEAWPPAYRFQYAGPVLGIERASDGASLIVYLADRTAQIAGGPETIAFYSIDFLSNFGISSTNAVFRDGSVLGQFTTQAQYLQLLGEQKQDIGEHIGDYLAANVASSKAYVTMHRNGLDAGVWISNGVDRMLRYGTNVASWSVPYFPSFGAGALQSIETSVGQYSLMAGSPTGGKTSALGPLNPGLGASVGANTPIWVNPNNITLGSPTSYAVATFSAATTSAILRANTYTLSVPVTGVVQGVTLSLTGKQTVASNFNVTVQPSAGGGTSHTFTFGSSNTVETFGSAIDLWNMPWSQPATVNAGAISFDVTATYTGTTPGASGIWALFDQSANNHGLGSTASVGPITPTYAGEIAMVIGATSSGAMAAPAGWQAFAVGSFVSSYVQIQPTANPFTFSNGLGSSLSWDVLLPLFVTATTSFTAAITQVAITSNVVTITCANGFVVNTQAVISGLGTATFLNGQTLTILTASPTQFTAAFVHANYGPTADSGTATDVGIVQIGTSSPGNTVSDTITLTNPVTAGNTVFVIVGGIDSGGFGSGHCNITSLSGSTITPSSWTIINTSATTGNLPQANLAYQQNVTGGSAVTVTVQNSLIGCRWFVVEVAGGTFVPIPIVSISEAQIIVTYQNPGNYIYARDLNSWGDGGTYGANNGSPYSSAYITLGSLSLMPPGGAAGHLQHIVGYFDAVGTLNNGGASQPKIYILPNEFQPTMAVPFIQLPEAVQEPPTGQNNPSTSLQALRWPVNMMNSDAASQYIHHIQVKILFEPENYPNTIKALAFKENQD